VLLALATVVLLAAGTAAGQEAGPITETEPEETLDAETVSDLSTAVPVPTGGTVTPEPGLDPVLTDTARDTVYGLVQYGRAPTAGDIDQLRGLGYRRVRGVTETTQYARMPTENLQAIADTSLVRAVTAVQPDWRIAPDLDDRIAGSDDPVEVTVLTFEPLPEATVTRLEMTNGTGGTDVPMPGGTFTYAGSLVPFQVEELKRNQTVFWIDRAGRGELELVQGRRMVGAPMVADPLSGTAYDGAGVKVGVIDTGIDSDHPHFSGTSIVDAKDWADGDTDPEAPGVCDHGVHVAGTIAGNGSQSWYDIDVDRSVTSTVRGVAPNATPVVSRVFGVNASANDCSDWATAGVGPKRKFKKVRDRGAKIISNSWSHADDGDYDIPSSKTDTWARNHRDTLVVFANGNNDPQESGQHDKTPGLAKNVISVGALLDGSRSNGAGNVSDSSRSGTNGGSFLNNLDPAKDIGACNSGRKKPELYAPGHWITAPVTGGTYQTKLGTSMATPHVSGVAALFRQKHPNAKAAEVRAHLVSTAMAPYFQGYGAVNANNALFTNPYESVHGHFSGKLKKGKSDQSSFTVPEDAEKVVVTLVWQDPGHTPSVGAHVNCNAKGSGILANDLDLLAGPAGSVNRHANRNDNNVKRIIVDDPENDTTWKARVKAHRVTFLKKQKYHVVYRVVTDEPSLEIDAPDRVPVPAGSGNVTVPLTINGTGAPVPGITGDLRNGSAALCRRSGEFVAGTLSDGHSHTVERCLDVPEEPGTYDVTYVVNTSGPDPTITGGDGSPRLENATKTVTLDVPGPSINFVPYEENVSKGETTTYDIVMSNVSDGVGSFDVTVSLNIPPIGGITRAHVVPAATSSTVNIGASNDVVDITASGLDTDDTGNATIAKLTAQGVTPGVTGIRVDATSLRDEDGHLETVENRTAYRHGILRVNKTAPPTQLDVEIGSGSDDTSIAGQIGVGDRIRIRINESSIESEFGVEIESVNVDLGDGNTGTGLLTSHEYPGPGNYTMVAEVALRDGRLLTFTRYVEVVECESDSEAVCRYAPDGDVDTAALQQSIQDFLADSLDTAGLQAMIQAFLAG
jgi:subtilisin family serine protease